MPNNSLNMEERDKEFLLTIVRELVSNPDDVSVERNVDEMGVLLTLKVNPEDMGQVIGRKGQTARAIRTLLRIVGAVNHANVNLKIYEPEGSRRRSNDSSSNSGSAASESESATTTEEVGSGLDVDPLATDDLTL